MGLQERAPPHNPTWPRCCVGREQKSCRSQGSGWCSVMKTQVWFATAKDSPAELCCSSSKGLNEWLWRTETGREGRRTLCVQQSPSQPTLDSVHCSDAARTPQPCPCSSDGSKGLLSSEGCRTSPNVP